jgi:hypothetical protein
VVLSCDNVTEWLYSRSLRMMLTARVPPLREFQNYAWFDNGIVIYSRRVAGDYYIEVFTRHAYNPANCQID